MSNFFSVSDSLTVTLWLIASTVAALWLGLRQWRRSKALAHLSDQLRLIAGSNKPHARLAAPAACTDLQPLLNAFELMSRRARGALTPEDRTSLSGEAASGTALGTLPVVSLDALGQLTNGLVIVHGDSLLYCNQRCADFLGVTAEGLKERSLMEFVSTKQAKDAFDIFWRAVAGGMRADRYELSLTSSTGLLRKFELSACPIRFAGHGAALIVGHEARVQQEWQVTPDAVAVPHSGTTVEAGHGSGEISRADRNRRTDGQRVPGRRSEMMV